MEREGSSDQGLSNSCISAGDEDAVVHSKKLAASYQQSSFSCRLGAVSSFLQVSAVTVPHLARHIVELSQVYDRAGHFFNGRRTVQRMVRPS